MLCQDIQRPNASWLEDLGTTESVCPCQYTVDLRVEIAGTGKEFRSAHHGVSVDRPTQIALGQ